MKTEHWRIAIMGVIIAALAGYWISTLLKKTPAPSSKPGPVSSPLASAPDLLVRAPEKKEQEPAEKLETEQARGKNPFALPPGIRPLKKEEVSPATVSEKNLPDLRVNSIFFSNSRKLAIINSRVVTIGDEINNEKVIDIQRDRVVTQKGDQKRIIMLDKASLSLTVKGE